MGYNSYVASGQEITFSRPLKASETRALESVLDGLNWASFFLTVEAQEETIETDDGVLTKRTASMLTTTGNEGKAYELSEDLQKLINALPPDVTASGFIERIGEEWPDAERLHVIGRRVVSVTAEILWRDPS
jgi:hypothetical protein